MSENETGTETETQPTEATTTEAQDQRVPYDRFKQVNDTLQSTKAELDTIRAWKQEQEQAQLSEIEKATQAAQAAEDRATAAEQRAMTLERSQWVTAAARAAGFADPGDAALAVSLADVENEDAAKKAVEELAKTKPHWLAQAKPTGFGTIGDAGRRTGDEVPLGEDGKPDPKAGLGRELLNGLLSR